MLTRDRPFIKVAKYIAATDRELTHVDLVEDLPFYKGTDAYKKSLLDLATAWGYKNNIIIKKYIMDNIEFMRGESLKETDLDEIIISYGKHAAEGYKNETVKFSDMHKLTQMNGFNWVSHQVTGGLRRETNIMQGFNMIVIDVDGGIDIKTVQLLLKKYTYHIYTTKSHTKSINRFRLVLPINFILKLDKADYAEFMNNVYEFLPFDCDDQTNDRCRKWACWKGDYWFNDGELLDCLPFIPKTSKNTERKLAITSLSSLNNIERWMMSNIGQGNRNNMLLKYALVLVDTGHNVDAVKSNLMVFNDKLPIN